MPVNRLKLYAFAFGAGIAGLTGTLFASLNTAVFSSDFDTPLLITIYAIVILGGAGSLGGVILGALVVNVTLEVLRTPNHATWVFFGLIIAALLDRSCGRGACSARWSSATHRVRLRGARDRARRSGRPASTGTGAVDRDARQRPRPLGADSGRPDEGRQLGLRRPSSCSCSC